MFNYTKSAPLVSTCLRRIPYALREELKKTYLKRSGCMYVRLYTTALVLHSMQEKRWPMNALVTEHRIEILSQINIPFLELMSKLNEWVPENPVLTALDLMKGYHHGR